jgi:hypothetical protein
VDSLTQFIGWTQLSDKLHYPAGDSLRDAALFGLRAGKGFGSGMALEKMEKLVSIFTDD